MCLILFAYKANPGYDLILAANRDEFYHRPASPMHFWEENPDILAGKDIKSGGTWMGINRDKRFAALTNYRDPAVYRNDAASRGEIITDYLGSQKGPNHFAEELKQQAARFNGFNLIWGDIRRIYSFSNRDGRIMPVSPGLHGISNAFLNIPWPKVTLGKELLRDVLKKTINNKKSITSADLFSILENREMPPDRSLPDTGVGLETERMLSPIFIESANYGTRSSTIIIAKESGRADIWERTFSKGSHSVAREKHFQLR